MDVIVLRHGEAGKSMRPSPADAERGLTVSGAEEVEDVARAMKKMKLGLDLIATSPLRRALQTAEIAARVLQKEDVLESWPELRPEGRTTDLYSRLSKLPPDSAVALVGHEPYLSAMVSELIGGGEKSLRISLKKSGLAKVDVRGFTPRPQGELRWLLTPRQVIRLS
jgi:phosphohistidine phosphatase